MWHHMWQRESTVDRLRTVLLALDYCTPKSFTVIALATILVTTAALSLFSKLERICAAIRSSMNEERLVALDLLQVHRSDTPSLTLTYVDSSF